MKLHLSFHVAPVFPNLLLGDKHSSSSEKELFIRNKVTHVLNAAAEIKNRFEDRGVIYLQLALEDRIGEEVIEEAIKGAEFISKSWSMKIRSSRKEGLFLCTAHWVSLGRSPALLCT